MIRIVLYQNTNQKIAEACGKWFPRVVSDETIGLEELAAHMASHNTPYSKGAILGMLTDAAACTKELLLLGKNVKFADIAIFSLGLKVKGGAPTKEDFNVAKYILGLKLRARATGELKTENLDTTIKLINLAAPVTENPGNPVNPGIRMIPARIIHQVVVARLKAAVATPITPSRVAAEPRIAVIQMEAATTT